MRDLVTVEMNFRRTFRRFAPSFRLNCEHPGRANDHMIDVEAISDQIVKDTVALLSQIFQKLPNHALTVSSLPERTHLRKNAPNAPRRKRGQ
jgi:hypothetical protein